MRRSRYSVVALVLSVALAIASCGRESPTSPSEVDRSISPSLQSASIAPTVVYGPATFTRDTGKPRTDTTSFAARAGDTLTMLITSGAAQGLNATIDLNGVRVFPKTDGHPLPDTVRAVGRGTNTLKVWMAGKPGSQLRIAVTVPAPALPPETRVLSLIYGSDVLGSVPPGDVSYAVGTNVHYRFTPNVGFARLVVIVDGRVAADSGTITMNRTHWIAATADTAITLDATEQSLAQLLRAVLTGNTPREDWRAFQAALGRATTAWGDQARVHVARMQRVAIDPVSDLASLVRVDSALSGMVTSFDVPSAGAPMLDTPALGSVREADRVRRLGIATATGGREMTQIMLVNGIFNSYDDLDDNARLLNGMLRADLSRFPRESVLLSNFYSPSLYTADALHRIVLVCDQAVLTEVYVKAGLDLGVTRSAEVRGAGARFVACIVANGLHEEDLFVLWRWTHEAIGSAPVNEREVQNLAEHIRVRLDSLQHVLVVAHSRGSLQTQLAVQRLKSVYGYSEETAPRCIGTISVAGVGTANWPLTGRHARFIVAKHDLVTTLDGVARNTRDPLEDNDTRAVDRFLGETVPDSSASQLSMMEILLYPSTIHALDRYLKSEVSGPKILNYLDELYRTCAIGNVAVVPASATLQLYGAAGFTASWSALDGQPLTTSDSVKWSVDSELASVSQSGRAVAGSSLGTVSLQAKVRSAVGTADITIVDDSLRATFTPPVISGVETRREFMGMMNGPGPLQTKPPGALQWYMSISASAMIGATISKVEVFRRLRDSTSTEFVAYSGPLPEGEIYYQGLPYNGDGTPTPMAFDIFASEDFSWYRVVITDSHGLQTAFIGSSTDPSMLP